MANNNMPCHDAVNPALPAYALFISTQGETYR